MKIFDKLMPKRLRTMMVRPLPKPPGHTGSNPLQDQPIMWVVRSKTDKFLRLYYTMDWSTYDHSKPYNQTNGPTMIHKMRWTDDIEQAERFTPFQIQENGEVIQRVRQLLATRKGWYWERYEFKSVYVPVDQYIPVDKMDTGEYPV